MSPDDQARYGVFAREQQAIYEALKRGENPYGGLQNAINSIYNTYGHGSGVSYQEVAGMIKQAYDAAKSPSGGGGGGGGYSYDPNHDSGAINQYKSKIGGLQPTLNDLFNQIYAGINTQADQQRAEAQQNYNTQQQGLTNSFTKNLGSNAAAYTSRNAYDSSFRANAEDQIRNDYNTQTTANNQALNKNLAGIGQYVAQNRASIDASKPNYNLNDYGDVSSLSGLYNNLNSLQTTLKEKLAGLGSNDSYKSLLASSVPYQSTQSQAVVDQLNKLAGTTVSPQDKLTAASGYISQLPDQNSKDYWQNYYQNLVKQQQPQGA